MRRKRKVTPLSVKKYRKSRADPVGKIVNRHLEHIINESGMSRSEIIEKLKKYGKSYSSEEALKVMIFRSTVTLRTFIRIMMALGLSSYEINTIPEEVEEVELYESLKDD